MIRLYRTFAPIYLSPAMVAALTAEYKNNGAAVWNHSDIKGALLELSFNKCAYCECRLTEESKYLEVEHFKDKNSNPNNVVDWENLLPACKRCNGNKSNHNVIAEPIVNPFNDEPRGHLRLTWYRFRGITLTGQTTVDALNLNDSERAVATRFAIGEAVNDAIAHALERFVNYQQTASIIRRNKLTSQVMGLLSECKREAPYAATAATVLHANEDYLQLRQAMQNLKIWNDEMEAMHEASAQIRLN